MKKGFTLIEMLVVISLIGILGSVILISLKSAQEKALIAKANVEVDQIMLAANIVYQEYGYYPNDSHSHVVCPRDIVIEQGTGKTWGSFLQICEDPWGRPYEWTNKCKLPSGALVKRSDHEPQVDCEAFTDENEGPVGVVVNREGNEVPGVPATCTGSNLCYGQRGHDILNWSNVPDAVTPPPLMCVLVVASCGDLSLSQCSTRSGCSVSGTVCSGNMSASCGSFNQSQCTPGGCGWVASGSCGGTVSCSSYNSNQTSCQANGCSFTAGLCGGTVAACSTWNNNQTMCTSQLGCSYNPGNRKCTGTHRACSTYTSTQCGTQLNCSLGASSCSGSPSCGGFGSSQCPGVAGCSWTDTSSCQGSYSTSCSVYNQNQSSCQSASGCSWQGSVCTGNAGSCTTFSDQNSCSAQAGCSWE